ncbi:MAG: hypothetical protein ACE5LG_04630 [Anaerolineae bacterium]
MSSKRSLLFVVLLALLLVGTTLALVISKWGEEAPAEPTALPPSPTVVAQHTPLASPPPSPEPPTTATPLSTPTLEGTTTLEPTPTPWRLELVELPPIALPDWPRPADDNGLGIHFLAKAYYSEEELDRQIARMVSMRMKWALVIYGDEIQLRKAAIKFRDAGITVVWRRMARPYEPLFDLGRDVQILQEVGMPPYMQLYNEPSLPAEWDEREIDQERFLQNLLRAAARVYNAEGYVGLQFVDERWLVAALEEMKARGGEAIFGRMFFVPHPYGLNHPPDYTGDCNSVLGFLCFANVFEQEIGFVPPMIAGEGGWKYGATDDSHYPKVDDQLHAQYHRELFDWFRTGLLSNGQPLPDYLFAFCPWLLSDKMEDSAWFDSFAGDHTLTIEAVRSIPPFRRKFSWD